MTILVIGSRGQVGRALLRSAPDALGVARDRVDLSDLRGLRAALEAVFDRQPDIGAVINAAAYTAVDAAENDEAAAAAVNAHAPGIIAAACADREVPLVHFSTDYVFSGDASAPYTPDQPTDPINIYGRTKRDGERAAMEAGGAVAVLRTSWVYDALGKNFLTTMLRLAETRDALSVVGDQIGRPTYTGDLARAALAAARRLQTQPSLSGTYHVSNTGEPVSWAGFAQAIFEGSGKDVSVTPIPTTDYPTPARRPAYSVLDTTQFEAAFGHDLPSWRDALRRALAQGSEAGGPIAERGSS